MKNSMSTPTIQPKQEPLLFLMTHDPLVNETKISKSHKTGVIGGVQSTAEDRISIRARHAGTQRQKGPPHSPAGSIINGIGWNDLSREARVEAHRARVHVGHRSVRARVPAPVASGGGDLASEGGGRRSRGGEARAQPSRGGGARAAEASCAPASRLQSGHFASGLLELALARAGGGWPPVARCRWARHFGNRLRRAPLRVQPSRRGGRGGACRRPMRETTSARDRWLGVGPVASGFAGLRSAREDWLTDARGRPQASRRRRVAARPRATGRGGGRRGRLRGRRATAASTRSGSPAGPGPRPQHCSGSLPRRRTPPSSRCPFFPSDARHLPRAAISLMRSLPPFPTPREARTTGATATRPCARRAEARVWK